MHQVYYCLQSLLDPVFPRSCVLCGQLLSQAQSVCDPCRRQLPRLRPGCPCCARTLTPPALCGACQHQPPAFDRVTAPFAYQAPVDRLIQALKYRQQLALARVLGHWLADHIQDHANELPDAIVPVPLYSGRLRRRGFNQSLELARPLARRFHLPLLTRHIRRIRATRSQTDIPYAQRRQNLRGAFHITGPIRFPHVAIVDDVLTSGATVGELARCLRRNGVRRISVWVIARA